MPEPAPTSQTGIRNLVVAGVIGLFAIIVFALLWLFFVAPANPSAGLGWYIFAFATGITMIVLPCTLPLAFVIVPLSLGKGIRRGLGIALAFGVGVALMLSLYGIAAAIIGGAAIDTLGAPLEVVKNWVYFIAGVFALIFALGEIGLIKVRMPSYSGAAPAFIQHQGDFVKAFLLGVFLGNIGVGCPHPATPLLLIEIASSGDVAYGWTLFLTHAIGRILPLILLAILAILGVNGLNWLIARKERIEKATGWVMVYVAGFILVLGLFSHAWWVSSGSHTMFEKVTQEHRFLSALNTKLESSVEHTHSPEDTVGETGLFGLPLGLGNWTLVGLWIFPMWWWWRRERRRIDLIPTEKQVPEKETAYREWRARGEMFLVLSVLLAAVFIWALPQWFQHNVGMDHPHEPGTPQEHAHDDTHMMSDGTVMSGAEHDAHAGHAGGYHEIGDVVSGLAVSMTTESESPVAGEPTTISFFVHTRPQNTAFDNLKIVHEKYMHVIGMRDDLDEFFHIHPEQKEPGLWQLKYAFKEGGTYKFYVDVNDMDGAHTFGQTPIEVLGERNPATEVQFLKNVIVNNYQVSFEHDTPLVAGRDSSVQFTVHDVLGRGIILEDYLAEKMHLAVIGYNFEGYIHGHPAGHEQNEGDDVHMDDEHSHSMLPTIFAEIAFAHGEEEDGHIEVDSEPVTFSVNFDKPGIYKLYAQFRPDGIQLPKDESLVAEFFVEVEPDEGQEATTISAEAHEHTDDHHSTENTITQKVWLAIISLILMALVSKYVYRKIQVK